MLEPVSREHGSGAGEGCSTDGDMNSLAQERSDYLHGSLSDILEEDRNSFDVCSHLCFDVLFVCCIARKKKLCD